MSIRIALAQCRQSSDLSVNAETILRFMDQAGESGVQILCFPESQTVGYRVDVTSADAAVPVEFLEGLHSRVAQRCERWNMACILGTETPLESDPVGGKPYNSALVVSETGAMLGVHHKTRLTPLDATAYTPGEGFAVYELCGVTVGVVICFEGFRFPVTTRACVEQGSQLVFHPQNNTTRPNDWKIPIHHAMITTRAAENTIWFASCNCCHAPYQNCRTMVVAPDGQVHTQAEMNREELLICDLDINRATRAMYLFDRDGCADMLFGNTVQRSEYTAAGRMKQEN